MMVLHEQNLKVIKRKTSIVIESANEWVITYFVVMRRSYGCDFRWFYYSKVEQAFITVKVMPDDGNISEIQ